jgi:hypothetical protein
MGKMFPDRDANRLVWRLASTIKSGDPSLHGPGGGERQLGGAGADRDLG